MYLIRQQICSCEDWVRAADCHCSFEGSKQCSFRKDEVVALRYKTPVELLTKFSWGNASSGNHFGQVVTVFGHPLNKKVGILVGVVFPLILKWGVLYLPFCPLSLGLPLYTAEKTPNQSSLSPSTILIRCLYMLKRSLLIYLFWRPARPAAPASPSMSDVPIPWSSLWLFVDY